MFVSLNKRMQEWNAMKEERFVELMSSHLFPDFRMQISYNYNTIPPLSLELHHLEVDDAAKYSTLQNDVAHLLSC